MTTNSNFLRGLPSSSKLHRHTVRRLNRSSKRLKAAKRTTELQRQKEQRMARSIAHSQPVVEAIKNLRQPLMTRMMARMKQFVRKVIE